MNDFLVQIAAWIGLSTATTTAVAIVYGLLTAGSVARMIAVARLTPEQRRTRLGSLAVWWVGLTLIVVLAAFGTPIVTYSLGVLALYGLHEYFRLLDALGQARHGRRLAWGVTLGTYLWLAWFGQWPGVAALFALLAAISARHIGLGQTRGYLAGVAGLLWGTCLLALLLPHAALLFEWPAAMNRVGGGAGWFLYLVILTETDDIFQALWGRRFGRTFITPRISPHKTLEGLVGGIASTVATGVLLAPWLTPLAAPVVVSWGETSWSLPYLGVVVSSLVICSAGFLGDLNMSALKRDAGVKDTGALLPGQGGLLDRIDSLIFTAPAFYYFVQLWHLLTGPRG